jgi:hypothetical protein
LDLSGNSLKEYTEDINILSDALMVNQTLTTLYLEENDIGRNLEQIKILLDALKVNQTLTKLDLRSNGLGENDLIELSQNENLEILI